MKQLSNSNAASQFPHLVTIPYHAAWRAESIGLFGAHFNTANECALNTIIFTLVQAALSDKILS